MSAMTAVEDLIMITIARRGTGVYYSDSIRGIMVPGKCVDREVKDGEIAVHWAGYQSHGFSVPIADPDAVEKLMEYLYRLEDATLVRTACRCCAGFKN